MSARTLAEAVLNQAFSDIMGRKAHGNYTRKRHRIEDPVQEARLFLLQEEGAWAERREFWSRVAGRNPDDVRSKAISIELRGLKMKGCGSGRVITGA
jgi:hypothetical protein